MCRILTLGKSMRHVHTRSIQRTVKTYKDHLLSHQYSGHKVGYSGVNLPQITGLSPDGLVVKAKPTQETSLTFRRCSVHMSALRNWPEIVLTFPTT